MGGIWPVVTRTIAARPLRALLTALAVALGVAAVLGVQVTLSALDRQASDVAGQRAGRSSVDVRAVAGPGLDAAELVQLSRTPGVAEVQPLYQKRVAAKALADQLDGVDVTVVAVSGGEAALRPIVVTQGRLPSEARNRHEVALDGGVVESLAALTGQRLRIGDTVYLTTSTGPDAFTLTGISAGTSGGAAFTRSAAFVSMAEATGPFALGIRTPLAALRLEPGADAAAVAARVRTGLGPVVTTSDPRAGTEEPLSQLRPLLALLVVLSVILGAGVSANSIAVSAVERRRDTGLLRAAGASRRQVLALFLAETALVAVAGAAAGLLVGMGLATLLVHLAAPADLPAPSLTPGAGQVVAAVAAGVGAAFAGALLPAIAATRVSALRAVRPSPGDERERLPGWTGAAGILIAATGGLLMYVDAAAAAAAGAVVTLLGLALALPVFAPALMKGLASLLAPVLRHAPVAAANLARRRTRSGLVLGVLTISVASAVALGSLTSGAMAAGNDWVAHLFAGDTVVVSPATARDDVAAQISSSAGVTVGRLRFLSAQVDGSVIGITAADLEPYVDHGGLDIVEGDRKATLDRTRRTPAAIVPQQLADRYGWHLGHLLTLNTAGDGGPVTVTVAGVAAHTFPGGDGRESLVMGRGPALATFGTVATGFDDLQVVGGTQSGGNLQRIASSYGMQVAAVSEIQAAAGRSIEHSLQFLSVLGWLGVTVAMLAVVNTLVVNVRHGTRELALLRAVGLSRAQSLRLVLVEAGLLALTGALIGTLAGCAIAAPLLRASASSGFVPGFVLPLGAIAAVTAGVVASALLAAYLPARNAARSSIVGAIRYE